ncbi:MAG: carboxypeptidase regulatory-like domain-containing protein [Polyangiales bacterium]
MRYLLAPLVVALWTGCGSPERRGGDDVEVDACVGLECRITNCTARGMPDTTISGTVFAPNGTLALYGVTVYIPNSDPGPLPDGVACSQCQNALPGGSVAQMLSGADGKFMLTKVPDGVNVPLVIQVGKWRRRVDIPEVLACQDNVLPPNVTSLPKNKLEGDLPKIAITTGGCDALECLVRRLGVDAKEFTTEAGTGRINLYNSGGASGTADGTPLPTGDSLWGDLTKLKKYDIAAFSCECSPHSAATPTMMNNVKAFADLGGRVFMSHYNAQWISGSGSAPQPVWSSVATCNVDTTPISTVGTIDQVNNPKGAAFATWMTNVMASSGAGTFTITQGRESCTMVDNTKAERWVYVQESAGQIPQNFQFTTPQESPKDNRCGKVVFSDMHVASDFSSGNFPSGCSATPLSAQEKALAFMFFDVASCVGTIL